VHRCCVCGCTVNGTTWLCHYCARTYSLQGRVSTWPDWARFLLSDEQRQRRADDRDAAMLCDSDEADECCYGETNRD